MATDFVHTEELVDAVISVLEGADGTTHTGGLPAGWFGDATSDEPELERLEHGDLADTANADELKNLSPAILVRGLGPTPTGRGGAGGVQETEEIIRVVHFRMFDDCRDSDGDRTTDYSRARSRYAKIISKALFNDPNRKLATIDSTDARTETSLTCSDGAGAQIVQVLWSGWDLGSDIGNPNATEDVQRIRALSIRAWAIACDLRVQIRSGGQS